MDSFPRMLWEVASWAASLSLAGCFLLPAPLRGSVADGSVRPSTIPAIGFLRSAFLWLPSILRREEGSTATRLEESRLLNCFLYLPSSTTTESSP